MRKKIKRNVALPLKVSLQPYLIEMTSLCQEIPHSADGSFSQL